MQLEALIAKYPVDRPERLSHEGPAAAYCEFLAAIARRDVVGTLACMSEEYGRDLRTMRAEANFSAFFDLWCSTYPDEVKLVASTIQKDMAVFNIEGYVEGLAFSNRVVLDRVGAIWYVSSESSGA